jgi:hypothetical protein
MKQYDPNLRELFDLYNRQWFGTHDVVRLIRFEALTNIYPACLVSWHKFASQHLAVDFVGHKGGQPAIFEKVTNSESWKCLNYKKLGTKTTAELIAYAKEMAKSLPGDHELPQVTMEHVWAMYHLNYKTMDLAMKPIASDKGICAYPWIFKMPDEKNNPNAFVLESVSGHSIVVRPDVTGLAGKTVVTYQNLSQGGLMTFEEIKAFCLK